MCIHDSSLTGYVVITQILLGDSAFITVKRRLIYHSKCNIKGGLNFSVSMDWRIGSSSGSSTIILLYSRAVCSSAPSGPIVASVGFRRSSVWHYSIYDETSSIIHSSIYITLLRDYYLSPVDIAFVIPSLISTAVWFILLCDTYKVCSGL